MSTQAEQGFPASHPLRHDRLRLERIADLMWDEIHSVLFKGRAVRRRGSPGGTELTLIGGTSADEILQEALVGLLRYRPVPNINWEGLGVRIAHNKAVGALRKSGKHRNLPDGSQIQIASLDREDEDGDRLVDKVPEPGDTGYTEEEAVLRVHQLDLNRALRRIAEATLNEREREIVHRIQRGETRRSLEEEYGVTEQRVGQIYNGAIKKLREAAQNDPAIQLLIEPNEGGKPQ